MQIKSLCFGGFCFKKSAKKVSEVRHERKAVLTNIHLAVLLITSLTIREDSLCIAISIFICHCMMIQYSQSCLQYTWIRS